LIFQIEVEGYIELAVFLYVNESYKVSLIDRMMRKQDSLAIVMKRATGSRGEDKEMARRDKISSSSVRPSPR
jgi:hypothetical protein